MQRPQPATLNGKLADASFIASPVVHLIHVRLTSNHRTPLPENAADHFMRHARTEEGVEHVVIHPHDGGAVVGLFVLAPDLRSAEHVAATVCRRTVDLAPELEGFSVGAYDVAMLTTYYDWLLKDDPDARGDGGQSPHPGDYA